MKFGDNLRKIRILKKLSQENLAKKMRVSRQSVSKWETGDAYFHCKISDLVNDSIIDIGSLGDEIKTKVVSLKKEEKKKKYRLYCIILLGGIGI